MTILPVTGHCNTFLKYLRTVEEAVGDSISEDEADGCPLRTQTEYQNLVDTKSLRERFMILNHFYKLAGNPNGH